VIGSEGLQRRLATVHALLSNIPDAVILVDGQVGVREANEAARALLPALTLGEPLFYALRAPRFFRASRRF
jgi:two-component system phosphate regulon sensor histidine kinase PhoR